MYGGVELDLEYEAEEKVSEWKGKDGLSHPVEGEEERAQVDDGVEEDEDGGKRGHQDVSRGYSVDLLLKHELVSHVDV